MLNFVWCFKLGVVCVIFGIGFMFINFVYYIVINLRSGFGIVFLMIGIVMFFIYIIYIFIECFK